MEYANTVKICEKRKLRYPSALFLNDTQQAAQDNLRSIQHEWQDLN